MKRTITLLLAAAMTQAAFANLLVNPGLESPGGENDTADGWNMVQINNDGNVYDTGTFIGFAAHTGDRGLWFRSFMGGPSWGSPSPVDCILTQTVSGSAGLSYTLSAWFKFEQGYSGISANFPETQSWLKMEFLDASGAVLGTSALDIDTVINPIPLWQQFSVTGVSPTGTASVRVGADFQNGRINTVDPQSAFVDDFNLEAVPEPATMTALAVGALALIRRRRSK